MSLLSFVPYIPTERDQGSVAIAGLGLHCPVEIATVFRMEYPIAFLSSSSTLIIVEIMDLVLAAWLGR